MSNLDLSIAKIMHGDTPVLKIMQGDTKVWPDSNTAIIDCAFTNVTSSIPLPATVALNSSFTVTLTPDSDYVIYQVTVVMGNNDITSTTYSNGVVSIANVTEDVTITAKAYSPVTHDWILSDESGRIDTGFVPTGTDIKIVAKFSVLRYKTTNAWLAILAAYSGENYNAYRVNRYSSNTNAFYVSCGNKASSGRLVASSLNTIYEMELTNTKIKLNGTTTSLYTNQGTANTGSFYISAANVKLRLWSLKIYKGDVLKVDLVPVSVGDIACMKDNVSGEYLFPSSSGFTVGDDT